MHAHHHALHIFALWLLGVDRNPFLTSIHTRSHLKQETLAHSITAEQGKTLADARGDVFRGLEVVEFACGMPSHMKGELVRECAFSVPHEWA